MHRATLASLAVAAVLGISGGIALAVNATDSGEQDPAAGATTSAGAADPTGPAVDGGGSDNALYYADGAIHDGDASVAVPDSIDPSLLMSLARVEGGWLLIQSGDDNPNNTATFVSTDGESWRIGATQGHWDLDADRARLYYDTGTTWKVAEFSQRSAEVIGILGGGDDLDFMTLRNHVAGISYGAEGLITAWQDAGSVRLVSTDVDSGVHTLLGIEDVSLPDSSGDGSRLVSEFDNPDYTPTNPVGSCATGGSSTAVSPTSWWQQCTRGPVTSEPFSRDGSSLLLGETVGDGPPGSSLVVVDAVSGDVVHEIDPGGYFVSATWSDNPDVITTLTADDETGIQELSSCDVGTGVCGDVIELEGYVVLGTVG